MVFILSAERWEAPQWRVLRSVIGSGVRMEDEDRLDMWKRDMNLERDYLRCPDQFASGEACAGDACIERHSSIYESRLMQMRTAVRMGRWAE
jgi:hypothetical protein